MRPKAFFVTNTRLRLGRLAAALALGLALVSPGSPVVAQSPARGGAAAFKLDSELRHRIGNGRRHQAKRVIVRVKPGTAARMQGLLRALGVKVKRFNPLINSFSLEAGDAERLAEYLDVVSISLDADIRANQAAPPSRLRRR